MEGCRETPNVSLEHRETSGSSVIARGYIEGVNRPPCIIYASTSRCYVNVRKYVTSSISSNAGVFEEQQEEEEEGGLKRRDVYLVLSNENLGRSPVNA